jgi:DNA-binding NarL/FixJ family response regulator
MAVLAARRKSQNWQIYQICKYFWLKHVTTGDISGNNGAACLPQHGEMRLECGMSQEIAQEVTKLANLDKGCGSRLSPEGWSVIAQSFARGASVRTDQPLENSVDDSWKRRESQHYRDVRNQRLDLGDGGESAGWEVPTVDGRKSVLTWGRTECPDSILDRRILIIDDCTLYRENLATVFVARGAVLPGAAWDLPSLLTSLGEVTPDVVLLNLNSRDSVMLLRTVFEVQPNMRVVVLAVSEDDEAGIVACAEAGVAGYHLRTESLDDLLVLVRGVADGESLCSPRVSAILLRRLSALAAQRQPAANDLDLTDREIQILRMLEMGLSNREIAKRLCIAVHTVKNHVHNLLTKLGVSTRAEAAALCRSRMVHSNAVED